MTLIRCRCCDCDKERTVREYDSASCPCGGECLPLYTFTVPKPAAKAA